MSRRPSPRKKAPSRVVRSTSHKTRPRKPKPIPDRPAAVARAPKPGLTATPETPSEDPVVTAIMHGLSDAASLSPRDIAERIAAERAKPGDPPNVWRRYFAAVKQHAVNLARAGKIEIVRKGKVVDPSDFKGIVRYRLARGAESSGDPSSADQK